MNLMELMVKIGGDTSDLDKSLGGIGSKVSGALGGVMSGAAKITTAAVGAAAAGVTALTTQSVKAYANFQQLQGGVETLFGAGGLNLQEYADKVGMTTEEAAADWNKLQDVEADVFKNAKNAYKDAGLSMNEYMETAASMAASLNQSLGGDTAAAAAKADLAIKDMADNANKMGTSMESIQNAYAGFSKQNYTMLDNLKLGYGGTKKEMERLLEDAEKLKAKNGEIVDYSIDSYADIVDAIHAIQEETGITGTTANEAATTISGSLGMLKSSWQNLLTAMASEDEIPLSEMIDNVVSSAKIAFDNLSPVVSQALRGIAQLIKEIAPQISKELPGLFMDIVPDLVDAITEMIEAVIPVIGELGAEIVPKLVEVIVENLPILVEAAMEIIGALGNGIIENLPLIIDSTIQILTMILNTIIQNLPQIIAAGIQIIVALINGIANAIPQLIPAITASIPVLVNTLISHLPELIQAGMQLLIAVGNGLINAIPQLVSNVPTIISNLVSTFVGRLPQLVNTGVQLIVGLGSGLINAIPQLVANIPQILSAIVNGILTGVPALIDAGGQLLAGIWNGISNKLGWLKDCICGLGSSIVGWVKGIFGIASPSKVFAGIGEFLAEGLGVGWENEIGDVKKTIGDDLDYSANMDFTGNTATTGGVALAGAGGETFGDIIIPFYLDGSLVDERIIKAQQIHDYMSGGR